MQAFLKVLFFYLNDIFISYNLNLNFFDGFYDFFWNTLSPHFKQSHFSL